MTVLKDVSGRKYNLLVFGLVSSEDFEKMVPCLSSFQCLNNLWTSYGSSFTYLLNCSMLEDVNETLS